LEAHATTGCLDDSTLIAYSEGRLSSPEWQQLRAHVNGCALCFVLLTEAARAARSSAHADTLSISRQRAVPWEPPAIVDELRIEERIGRGSGGQVFRAVDTRLDRPVAIKFLAVEPGGSERERFALEARALARLSHPNVVTVHRAGEVAGRPFLVSELVRGRSLNHVAKPLPWQQVLDIGIGLVRGLVAAHRAGVLHRDIKPANAILGDDGTVKLLDFGLAKLIEGGAMAGPLTSATDSPVPALPRDASPTLTTTGAVVGTPLYMAPEAWLGEAPTPQTDIYSMGALLYELLLGVPPHIGGRLSDVRRQALAGDVRVRAPDMPAPLVAVLAQCLRRDPAARYASAEALLAALEAIRPSPARRRRTIALVAGAFMLVAGTLPLAVRSAVHRAAPAWHAEIIDHQPVFEENADSPTFSPDGKWISYTSDRDGSWHIYRQPRDRSAAAVPITPPGWNVVAPQWSRDSRFIYFSDNQRLFRVPAEGGSRELVTSWKAAHAVCGERLVIARLGAPDCGNCQRILVRNGNSERELVRVQGSVYLMACDREGKQLVYTVVADGHVSTGHLRGDLYLISVDGGAPRALTSDGLNAGPVFHPDGKSIIFASERGGHLNLWELRLDGSAPEQLTFGDGPDGAPDVSPDGREIIFDIDNTYMPLFAYSGKGMPRRWITHALGDVNAVVPTRDGKELIVGVVQGRLRRIVSYPLPTGDERIITEGESPALTADERELVFARREGKVTRILAMPRAGGPERLVATLPQTVGALSVGGDGIIDISLGRTWSEFGVLSVPLAGGTPTRELDAPWRTVTAHGDDRIGLRYDNGQVLAFLRHGNEPWSAARRLPILVRDDVAWYPNGRAIVYLTGADARRYDLTSGSDAKLFDTGLAREGGLAASADGTTIYAVEAYSHVRRALITNYGQRPRPR
jgi:serine/threonine protein kinase